MTKRDIVSKIHLCISTLVVIPAAFIYGFNLADFLDLNPNSIDEYNFFKAVSVLYLGFSVLWILGIIKSKYLKQALLSNFIFMLSLALGRILSIFVDGVPSLAYILGTAGEMILGLYGLWVYLRLDKRIN